MPDSQYTIWEIRVWFCLTLGIPTKDQSNKMILAELRRRFPEFEALIDEQPNKTSDDRRVALEKLFPIIIGLWRENQ